MLTKNPEVVQASLATLAESQAEIGEQCQPAIGSTAARWRYAGDSAAAAKRAADSRLRSKARTVLIAGARVTAA